MGSGLVYPRVLDELATIEKVHEGFSLSRFGDGELKIALGRDAKSQRGDSRLAAILRDVLKRPIPNLVVGIPNINSTSAPTLTLVDRPRESPKAHFWRQYLEPRYVRLYDVGLTYGSSFVTRPDSAPWVDVPAYWTRVVDLWSGRDVVLVRGSTKSLTAADLTAAGEVEEIVGPRQHAFAEYDELFGRLRRERRRVILCLGATATALAWALAKEGVQAVDVGHVGMFLRKEGRFERESFPQ